MDMYDYFKMLHEAAERNAQEKSESTGEPKDSSDHTGSDMRAKRY